MILKFKFNDVFLLSVDTNSFITRLEFPNPVKSSSINESAVENFVKSTREQTEQSIHTDTRGARSWAQWAHRDQVEEEGGKEKVDFSKLSADYLKNIMETVSSSAVQTQAKVP